MTPRRRPGRSARSPGRTSARGRARTRSPRGRSLVGALYEVEVGPVAHGGHCVARVDEARPEVGGTVVFVRHALPGERAMVEITEGTVGDRFLRGDAVQVLAASPDRVAAPCPLAGPGLCGGCDFQHVAPAAQRRLKQDVLAEQLRRLAGLDLQPVVEAVPGDEEGLRWRTRMRFHRTPAGRLGLRKHRSRELVAVEDCLLQAPEAVVVVEGEPSPASQGEVSVAGADFVVATEGFWQVHRGAPETLVSAVMEAAGVRPGDRVLDLYAGVGLFTAFLAQTAGSEGSVLAVEGDRRAAAHAEQNLAGQAQVQVVAGQVERVLAGPALGAGRGVDVVVLDPPREGARRGVVEAVAARTPRTVVLVSCDPAAFARDVALFGGHGYGLGSVRGFDLFPMTHHLEVVAALHRLT